MSAPDLIFEEPPSKTPGGGPVAGSSPFGLWLAALRDHPGQWAKYPEARYAGDATAVRNGGRYGVKAGEFETRTVGTGAGRRVWIYARYIGGES